MHNQIKQKHKTVFPSKGAKAFLQSREATFVFSSYLKKCRQTKRRTGKETLVPFVLHACGCSSVCLSFGCVPVSQCFFGGTGFWFFWREERRRVERLFVFGWVLFSPYLLSFLLSCLFPFFLPLCLSSFLFSLAGLFAFFLSFVLSLFACVIFSLSVLSLSHLSPFVCASLPFCLRTFLSSIHSLFPSLHPSLPPSFLSFFLSFCVGGPLVG
mmetsp:Transcript_12259/g.23748  ORF Transcript_12259/g.23748 Transcript_12259/m.23748 type:complete len:212 (+) Transcript_12259:510-1145(+)